MSNTLFDVTDQIALVTGASAGLGAHFARTLGARGAVVALGARRVDKLQQVVAQIEAAGGRALAVALDVSDPDSVGAALDTIEAAHGVPDILINNAGVAHTQRFLDITPEVWQRTLDVNLTGVFRVGQATAQRMVAADKPGSIVNISSLLGYVVQPTQTAYASSKAAVVHLTRQMALELGRHRIRVNGIAPGYFVTDMNREFFESEAGAQLAKRLFPRRTGKLEELDGTLLLLASDASRYMTGVTIQVDGGTGLAFG